MNFAFELPPDALDALAAKVAERLASVGRRDPEAWIGAKDAAKHLGCQPRRIYELATQGRIPHVRDGSRLLFRRSEIDSALESGRMELP